MKKKKATKNKKLPIAFEEAIRKIVITRKKDVLKAIEKDKNKRNKN